MQPSLPPDASSSGRATNLIALLSACILPARECFKTRACLDLPPARDHSSGFFRSTSSLCHRSLKSPTVAMTKQTLKSIASTRINPFHILLAFNFSLNARPECAVFIDQFHLLLCTEKQFWRMMEDRPLCCRRLALPDRAIRVRFCRRPPGSGRLPDE